MNSALATQQICKHATPIAEGVNQCDLKLFGGRPSVMTCQLCVQREKPDSHGLLSAARERELELKQSCCSACDQHFGFQPLPGTEIDVFTLCRACSCARKRVNLLTGRCPMKKWTSHD